MHHQQRFRSDIHGLRGAAVALVVAEHVFGWPLGGFVGVDVFFVISGYVITGSLLRQHRAAGRIDLRSFFVRRARRLAPAAALVVLTSVGLAHLLFANGRASQVWSDALWTAALASNWHFAARQVDYFASDGPVSPLLHLWSLAVEEQFYVVIPAVIAAALCIGRRRGRSERFAIVAVGIVTGLSLGWSVIESSSQPDVAYFSTFSRAWELGVGGLVVMCGRLWLRLGGRTARLLGWTGLVLVGVSAGLLDGRVAFPAPAGSLPVLGAALVLISGAGARYQGPAVLRSGPFSALGSLSYSLYLWHFPVLVFLASADIAPAWLVVPVSLGLAFATYRLVERPFLHVDLCAPRRQRDGRRWSDAYRGCGPALLTACVTLAGSLCLAAVTAQAPTPTVSTATDSAADTGSAARAAPDRSTDDATDPDLRSRSELLRQALQVSSWTGVEPSLDEVTAEGYLEGVAQDERWRRVLRCSQAWDVSAADACTFGDAEGQTVLLVGDSTGAFTAPALQAIAERPASGIRIINATRFACPWVDEALAFTDDVEGCTAHKQRVLEAIETLKPDRILAVNVASATVEDARGHRLSHRRWAAGMASMAAKTPAVRTTVMLPNPTGPDIRTCATPRSSPGACVTTPAVNQARASALRAVFAAGDVVDTSPVWCVGGQCPALVRGVLVRVDGSHVNPSAAVSAAAALRTTLGNAGLFEPVARSGEDEADG